jgi:hypothetical protein
MSIVLLPSIVGVCLFGPGLLAAFVAWKNGYRPWFWLLALGPIGMLVTFFQRDLADAKTPEERERWERSMDLTGGILSGITLFLMFAALGLGAMTFLAFAPTPIPAPIVGPTAPLPAVSPDVQESSTSDAEHKSDKGQ